MTLENGQHFINLREVLSSSLLPNGKIGFEFGASPISVVPKEQNKPARRADRHLTAMIRAGIFAENKIITGGSALIHDFNNSAYVHMLDGDGRYWFVHPRVLVQKGGKAEYANEFPLQDVQDKLKQGPLHVVSGVCLFGTAGASVFDERGHKFSLTDPVEVTEIQTKITKLEITHNLHPYEVDIILRLAEFMTKIKPNGAVELDFHIPRLEYWMYGLTLYEKGLMNSTALLSWFSEVNQRSSGIEKLLRKRMPRHVTMHVVNPLATIENIIEQAVNSTQHGMQGKLIEELASKDNLWAAMLNVSQRAQTDLLELNYQAYIYTYLKTLNKGDGLMLAIESPEETNIIENTKNALVLGVNKDGKQPAIVIGLFVHPHMLVPEGKAKGDKKVLYFAEDLSTAGLKEIFNSHR